MKEYNIVPPLSDGSFVMIVAFVQDSKTYIMDVNTKGGGKNKFHFSCVKICEGKRCQLDKRIRTK
jgi:hypothetical protein